MNRAELIEVLDDAITDNGYWHLPKGQAEKGLDAILNYLAKEGEVEWYCFPWENRQGVSEPCESGSTHDGNSGCHWRLCIRVSDGGADQGWTGDPNGDLYDQEAGQWLK